MTELHSSSYSDRVTFQDVCVRARARVCVCVCVCVYHLIYPFTCWWTLRLHCFPIVNNTAMNIGLHASFQIQDCIFWSYMPRSEIGFYSTSNFSVLRNLQTVFHSGHINLHYCQWYTRVPFSPYPCQHLLIVQFLIIAILTGEWWQFTVVLIFISVRMSSVEYSFNVLVSHLWVLFGKMSIQVFRLSFKLTCFFILNSMHACSVMFDSL